MTAAPGAISLTGNDLTFEQLYGVALRGEKVSIALDSASWPRYASRRSRCGNCRSIWCVPTRAASERH
jgi:hypothetical protein